MMVSCYSGYPRRDGYTIRISATQSYVPDEKKGPSTRRVQHAQHRQQLHGQSARGRAGGVSPRARRVLTGFMLVTAAAAVIVIGGGREDVSAIYNRQRIRNVTIKI